MPRFPVTQSLRALLATARLLPSLVLGAGLALGACDIAAVETPRVAPPDAAAYASQVVTLTNAERSRAGLAALASSDVLARAAQLQADQVAATGVFEHTIPGAAYPTLADRLRAVGYEGFRAAGENLAESSGGLSAADVMALWMSSPGHRANILGTYSELGVALATDRAGRVVVVQVFGLR